MTMPMIACEHCDAAFPAPERWPHPWVECPGCRRRIPCPVPDTEPSLSRTLVYRAGAIILLSGFMGTVQVMLRFAEVWRLGDVGELLSMPLPVWLLVGACLAAFAAGLVLMVWATRGANWAAYNTRAATAIITSAAIVGVAAVVLILGTCTGIG